MKKHVLILLLFAIPMVLKGPLLASDQEKTDADMERFFTFASSGENTAAVRMLSEPGFASSVDTDGHTPLFAAAGAGNSLLVEEVLKHPYNLAHRDSAGCTVVWHLAGVGHNDILKRLLALGGPAGIPCNDGMTPLMAAVTGRNHHAIPLLVEAGADINATQEGATALILAVLLNGPDSVRELLAAGADSSVRFKGKTALEIARVKSLSDIENLLVQHQRRAQ